MKYIFTNIIGCFVLDEKLQIIDEILFKDINDYINRKKSEEKLSKKYKNLAKVPKEKIAEILVLFKKKEYYELFYKVNQVLTRQGIKNSVTEDQLIIQAIANINELDKTSNILTKRLREWYSLYLPEISESISSHEKYVELIFSKNKEQLLEELSLTTEDSLGAELKKVHVAEMEKLAKTIIEMYNLRKQHEKYLQEVMEKYCPNLCELAGVTIAAKLIELAKSLKRLAFLPSSTLQLLGAEKALFRHLKMGSRSPKHGIIVNHPLIQKAAKQNKGKAARMLADKLSICAKIDLFKGEFKAKEYQKELEEKLK